MVRLLLIEDDAELRAALEAVLQRHGHDVRSAPDGLAGLRALDHEPEVIVMDLGLPDLSGLEVIGRVRASRSTPIVVLSGSRESDAVSSALDAGADDFVAKPFRLGDLEARVRAVLRRGAGEVSTPRVRLGGLVIDFESRTVTVDDDPRHLTPTEWKVLEVLAQGRGRVVSHRVLALSVWGQADYAQARETLRVHVGALRAKLSRGGGEPSPITTESGIGYRMIHLDVEGDPPADRAPDQSAVSSRQPAGGGHAALAHDLNNAMATLSVIAGMLDPRVGLSDAAREEAIERLGRTVVSLGSLVDDAVELLR